LAVLYTLGVEMDGRGRKLTTSTFFIRQLINGHFHGISSDDVGR
jgi:hypothetical protein